MIVVVSIFVHERYLNSLNLNQAFINIAILHFKVKKISTMFNVKYCQLLNSARQPLCLLTKADLLLRVGYRSRSIKYRLQMDDIRLYAFFKVLKNIQFFFFLKTASFLFACYGRDSLIIVIFTE